MSKARVYSSLWIVIILVIASCAQIVSPSGGAKDYKAPKALKYVPDSAATNFRSKEIVIFFDEYIQLKDVNTQLVISPPLRTAPDLRVRGKALYITFSDTLRENTTYTMNFGRSITDITEANAIENFQYVFSTGAFIDSLVLSGKVLRSFDLKPEKGLLVMLYDKLNDSVPYKELPAYFARTNPDGTYRINNIRPGTYKAFALKDANSNYTFDPSESIAFSSEAVTIKSSRDTLSMSLFDEKSGKLIIKKKQAQQYGRVMIAFSAPVDKLQLDLLGATMKESPLIEYSQKRDTVIYWYRDETRDSLSLRISNNGTVLDTVDIRLITKEKALNSKRGEKLELLARPNVAKGSVADVKQDLVIELSNPVTSFDPAKLRLVRGKDTLQYKTTFIDSVHRKIRIDHTLMADSSYKLIMKKGAFTDIFGFVTDTMSIDFKVQSPRFYGNAKINVTLPAGNYILQLLNEKDAVVRENTSKGSIVLDYTLLKPGSYRLKLITDTNANGAWDTGNYLKKIQPEKVSFYPGSIGVRSNWDLELEWK
jgi:uncharacterized protein (DUF2141 family)